ncbi:hypothetical protein NS226_13130 [Aureimonas ureilytica]|uniref:Integrase n=1 Tax=Aureimonas ureilytica TaxID=401562 RepID=A0A175R6N9_9HYPH|nr:tyrosine-type recombinase/integrase [Aureimonas ureilytica]KTQ95127.1 hypothetical protein NS226_13130 [Aureimonas ureilytica]
MRKNPPYVQQFVDKTGRARFYFRRPGHARVPLPGLPWSPEFMAAHEAAVKGEPLAIGKVTPGTIDALCVAYYASANFRTLRPISQRGYRGVIERFRAEHGKKTVANLQREHVKAILAKLSDRPAAADRLRKMLKVLMAFAVDSGLRRDDPMIGVRKIGKSTSGFHTWTEEEIAQFEAHHPVGTRARIAFDVLLWTALRREDARLLGRQHVRGGRIVFRTSKTGAEITIPIRPELAASIATVPTGQMLFLVSGDGRDVPLTVGGYGNRFRDWVKAAKLPAGCAPHGLRKAACRRLAEAGCSASEIMAISGHKSLSEAQKYVEAANRQKLADNAFGRVATVKTSGPV